MVHYKVKRTGNPNSIIIHVDFRLCAIDYSNSSPTWEDDDDSDKDTIIGQNFGEKRVPKFLAHILQVNGVKDVHYDIYSISVDKGEMFSWRVLVPQIVANLSQDFNKGEAIPQLARPKYRLRRRAMKKATAPPVESSVTKPA